MYMGTANMALPEGHTDQKNNTHNFTSLDPEQNDV